MGLRACRRPAIVRPRCVSFFCVCLRAPLGLVVEVVSKHGVSRARVDQGDECVLW